MREAFLLDPGLVFLNHGSFGACPREVFDDWQRWQRELERSPVEFLGRRSAALLAAARETLAAHLGARQADLVFVPNATTGVNIVARSLMPALAPGDEVLATDHEYGACDATWQRLCAARGVSYRRVEVPLPFDAATFAARMMAAATERTKMIFASHITSTTALIFPLAELCAAARQRGIVTVIDGAHAPGQIELDLEAIGADHYAGNCHKWLCAPKGAAFLHVRRDRQELVCPLTISHGANSPRADRSRYLIEFGWTGTGDPTACLSVPEALRFMGSLLPGGWAAVMRRNRELALAARRVLCQALQVEAPCPDKFIGSLASLPLPDATDAAPSKSPLYLDPLQDALLEQHSIEVPIIPWPAPPKRLLRISSQLYNSLPQYERLAKALTDCPSGISPTESCFSN